MAQLNRANTKQTFASSGTRATAYTTLEIPTRSWRDRLKALQTSRAKDLTKRSTRAHAVIEDWSSLRGLAARIIFDHRFDVCVGIVVLANSLTLGLESELPDQREFFVVTDMIFLVIYTVEFLLRLHVFRARLLQFPANILDVVIVITGWASAAVDAFGGADGMETLSTITALKVLRAFRSIRLLRMFTFFEGSWIIVASFSGCLRPLFWMITFLTIILFTFTMFAIELVGNSGAFDGVPEKDEFISTHLAFFALFQLTTFDGWRHVVQPLCERQGWAYVFFAVYLSITALSLMNLVTAIVVDSSLKRTLNEEEFRRQRLKKQLELEGDCIRDFISALDGDGGADRESVLAGRSSGSGPAAASGRASEQALPPGPTLGSAPAAAVQEQDGGPNAASQAGADTWASAVAPRDDVEELSASLVPQLRSASLSLMRSVASAARAGRRRRDAVRQTSASALEARRTRKASSVRRTRKASQKWRAWLPLSAARSSSIDNQVNLCRAARNTSGRQFLLAKKAWWGIERILDAFCIERPEDVENIIAAVDRGSGNGMVNVSELLDTLLDLRQITEDKHRIALAQVCGANQSRCTMVERCLAQLNAPQACIRTLQQLLWRLERHQQERLRSVGGGSGASVPVATKSPARAPHDSEELDTALDVDVSAEITRELDLVQKEMQRQRWELVTQRRCLEELHAAVHELRELRASRQVKRVGST